MVKTKRITVVGASGRMGQMLCRAVEEKPDLELAGLIEIASHPLIGVAAKEKILGLKSALNFSSDVEEALSLSDAVIDFTNPETSVKIANLAAKHKVVSVIGSTGFSQLQLKEIAKSASKVTIIRAGNMSLGVNLLVYLTEIASRSLNNNFLSKVYEVHHKHKIDHPSGTALMLGKGIAIGKNKDFYNLVGKKYLNKKNFPYGKKINFNSIRKGETIGEHEVKFSSGKEIITLNHEAFDRALYSEGALTAAKWLMGKKPGFYSMRDVLNFK